MAKKLKVQGNGFYNKNGTYEQLREKLDKAIADNISPKKYKQLQATVETYEALQKNDGFDDLGFKEKISDFENNKINVYNNDDFNKKRAAPLAQTAGKNLSDAEKFYNNAKNWIEKAENAKTPEEATQYMVKAKGEMKKGEHEEAKVRLVYGLQEAKNEPNPKISSRLKEIAHYEFEIAQIERYEYSDKQLTQISANHSSFGASITRNVPYLQEKINQLEDEVEGLRDGTYAGELSRPSDFLNFHKEGQTTIKEQGVVPTLIQGVDDTINHAKNDDKTRNGMKNIGNSLGNLGKTVFGNKIGGLFGDGLGGLGSMLPAVLIGGLAGALFTGGNPLGAVIGIVIALIAAAVIMPKITGGLAGLAAPSIEKHYGGNSVESGMAKTLANGDITIAQVKNQANEGNFYDVAIKQAMNGTQNDNSSVLINSLSSEIGETQSDLPQSDLSNEVFGRE